MKKIVLTVALCAASMFTFAQQGVMEIGGSFGITTSKNTTKDKTDDGTKTTTNSETFGFSIMPSLMYYMTDNIAIGGKIGFDYEKDKVYDIKETVFNIMPTIRYKKELGANFSWTPEFYIGFGFGNYNRELNDNESIDESIFNMNIGIHFARFEYAVSDKWVLSASFGKFGYDYEKIEDNKTNSFSLSLLEDSYVGIAYRF